VLNQGAWLRKVTISTQLRNGALIQWRRDDRTTCPAPWRVIYL